MLEILKTVLGSSPSEEGPALFGASPAASAPPVAPHPPTQFPPASGETGPRPVSGIAGGNSDLKNAETPEGEGEQQQKTVSHSEIAALFDLPFMDLMFQAQQVHRAHHDANRVQLSTLLSIKTGGCAENCGYCSQSASFETGLKASKLMDHDAVVASAREAKAAGSERFCMGAAWRSPKERDMPALTAMVAEVKALGLETCMTLGMLDRSQADRLADAGLDYYNHNLDSGPEFYGEVVTTRTYGDRLDTLENVRASGMAVCCGGILGMGESRADRVDFLHALATLPKHPESVPLNALVPIAGTPIGDRMIAGGETRIDDIEFVRTVAVARILMPTSSVRLSAGRESMSQACQALCFLAGANSIFTGDRLLTTGNAGGDADGALFAALGLSPMGAAA